MVSPNDCNYASRARELDLEGHRSLMAEFSDITYEVDNGLAWITINRPERYNAFRAQTVDELVLAFKRAWASSDVGVIA